jgi:hypothetical protein
VSDSLPPALVSGIVSIPNILATFALSSELFFSQMIFVHRWIKTKTAI